MRELKFLNLLILIGSAAIFVGGVKKDSLADRVDSLFRDIGIFPSSVSQTLALCENYGRESFLMELRMHVKRIQDAMDELKEFKKYPRNCRDLLKFGDKESGVRTVYPFSCCSDRPVSVFCDQTTDGGGWTVIQHREALPERENFFRNWVEYQIGFGKLEGEFWLGLNNIHALVSITLMELRVDLEDFEGKRRWAKYEYFYIGSAEDKYRLDLGAYSGNAGDSLTSSHKGQNFSTKDQDNDSFSENCAQSYRGAWWYSACHTSNLNGYQHEGNHTTYADGINWSEFRGHHYSLKTTSLSIRPKF